MSLFQNLARTSSLTFIINLAIAVNVGLADHLIHLLVRELLAEIGHDVAQLGRRDEAVAVLVEDSERLPDFLFAIGVLHFASHHGEKLGEVDRAVACGVGKKRLISNVVEKWLRSVAKNR